MNTPVQRGKFGLQSGFTLIEVMVVVVILSILAAVVVPKFTRRSEQARITAANTDIANLGLALDAFEIDVGRFPTTSEGLGALLEPPMNSVGWNGPYIKKGIPVDPWGKPYVYQYQGQYNTYGYDLYSYGPNGQEGGDDDIVNWAQK